MDDYSYYAMHFYSVRSIYLQSFKLIPFIVLKLCPGQNSKCEKASNFQIKEGMIMVLMHCTSSHSDVSIYKVYLSTNFQVDNFYSSQFMSRAMLKM
jgi:hypothetical protein